MSTAAPIIVWFERDLRLADNPALAEAVQSGRPVLPLFVLDDATAGPWRRGAASRWWLDRSLAALARDLTTVGLPLLLRRGPAARAVPAVVAESGAAAVVWNRRYEPWSRPRDAAIKEMLAQSGIAVRSHNAGLLREPWEVRTGEGEPYRVFTPFWRTLRAIGVAGRPLPAPAAATAPASLPAGDRLEDWDLSPRRPDWAGGLRRTWSPGEAGARRRLTEFLSAGLAGYRDGRDRPDRPGTSMLSPHLHFGELSPRLVWSAVADAVAADPGLAAGGEAYRRELGWREFSHHLLFHHDRLPDAPLRAEFADMPWRRAPDELRAWQRGRTGYPIVDAGMRQLWETGWMHNRVRMVVASFLVKDLLIPWQEGAAWFWDTLVDADLANNSASWQWVAGCGADAQPFFRVFNPVLQGRKFDPDGAYVRRFVPELARLPASWIHEPWKAPADVLAEAGVRLDRDYPRPIVDHGAARGRALAALEATRRSAA
ncbi:deoxyribodipyrimidine photo-lyase [Stella sp.]|uniref:cryptochrome/photolyase family protein n=1 Tax=Stella sp. TaxID=2912054 RepID=UPI0035B0315C